MNFKFKNLVIYFKFKRLVMYFKFKRLVMYFKFKRFKVMYRSDLITTSRMRINWCFRNQIKKSSDLFSHSIYNFKFEYLKNVLI